VVGGVFFVVGGLRCLGVVFWVWVFVGSGGVCWELLWGVVGVGGLWVVFWGGWLVWVVVVGLCLFGWVVVFVGWVVVGGGFVWLCWCVLW
jgi:hypothetical protein